MVKAKRLQNLSSNGAQLVLNQLCGFVVFYLLAAQLDKEDFGSLNFVLAFLLVAFQLLPLGMDQLAIRKVAGGQHAAQVLSVCLTHTLTTGLLFYAAVLICCAFFIAPQHAHLCWLLLTVGLGKLMMYFSVPFKQVIAGLERFRLLAGMLVISNLVRASGFIVLAWLGLITMERAAVLFALADGIECICCVFFFRTRLNIPITVNRHVATQWLQVRESLPQAGVTMITAAMSRMDWLLIGIIVSSAKLAEYSFAYKVFELATLPLLAVAPMLLPWLTRSFKHNADLTGKLAFLIRVELIIAVGTALALHMLWVPVVDTITAGKYGSINVSTVFFLSVSLPLLYLNNFFWSIYFAQGRMRLILISFVIAFAVKVALSLLLIPLFGNTGAALSFLMACLVQTAYYSCKHQLSELNRIGPLLLINLSCGLISGLTAKAYFTNGYQACLAAILMFMVLLVMARQIRWEDRRVLKALFT